MILIFGGTTEGKIAVEVCEKAGKPYFYSTKLAVKMPQMVNGQYITGAMKAADIAYFCRQHGVRCIVNAAHPFAVHLHREIARQQLPVIRMQRSFPPDIEGVTYFKDFTEASICLRQEPAKRLLCLSGGHTISLMALYWMQHDTVFRILNREESKLAARQCGLPMENIIFYNCDLHLPTVREEMEVMKSIGCDAILTKDSGDTGGFPTKVEAAHRLGIKVYVVRRPSLPDNWVYVDGHHALRHAIERQVPDFFPLRTGFTTGACATAATKAALISLLTDDWPTQVDFALPDGETVTMPVKVERSGMASVVKEPSDDPDVTQGCRIISTVTLREDDDDKSVRFLRGRGVGVVMLPGLGIPEGEPAINPVPRKCMENEIRQLTPCGVDVRLEVENGENIAQRTLNYKVGIAGGISIIGTSGIVSPLSNEAFINSIKQELRVARAMGCTEIAIASGKKGEEVLNKTYNMRCIHYGNFIGETLRAAYEMGFRRVVLGILIGKAVKLADGNLDTHSSSSTMNKELLKRIAAECGTNAQPANGWDGDFMARELWNCMPQSFFVRIKELCRQHCRTAFPTGELDIMLICDEQAG